MGGEERKHRTSRDALRYLGVAFVSWGSFFREPHAVSLKGSCAITLGQPTSPGAPGGLHTRGSLPLAQPKPRPLGKPFAPRGQK